MRIADNALFAPPACPPAKDDPRIRQAIAETGRRIAEMLRRQELYSTICGTDVYGKAVMG